MSEFSKLDFGVKSLTVHKFKQSVDEKVVCKLCGNVPLPQYAMECTNKLCMRLFCQECFMKYFIKYGCCPCCKKDSNCTVADKALQQLILDMEIKCIWNCNDFIKLKNMGEHQWDCHPIKLLNWVDNEHAGFLIKDTHGNVA